MVDTHVCEGGELPLYMVQYINCKFRMDVGNRRKRRQLVVALCRRLRKSVSQSIGVGRVKVAFNLFLDAVVIMYGFIHTHCELHEKVPIKRAIVVDCMCWWNSNRKLCNRLRMEVSNGYMSEAEITLLQLSRTSH